MDLVFECRGIEFEWEGLPKSIPTHTKKKFIDTQTTYRKERNRDGTQIQHRKTKLELLKNFIQAGLHNFEIKD